MTETKKEFLKFGDFVQEDSSNERSFYVTVSDPFMHPIWNKMAVYLVFPDGQVVASEAEISNIEKVLE